MFNWISIEHSLIKRTDEGNLSSFFVAFYDGLNLELYRRYNEYNIRFRCHMAFILLVNYDVFRWYWWTGMKFLSDRKIFKTKKPTQNCLPACQACHSLFESVTSSCKTKIYVKGNQSTTSKNFFYNSYINRHSLNQNVYFTRKLCCGNTWPFSIK